MEVIHSSKSVLYYTKSAFTIAIFSFILLGYFFFSIPEVITATEGFPVLPQVIGLILPFLVVAGIVLNIIGYLKKERKNWLFYTSAILNLLLLIIIVSLIIFASIIDLTR